ncbi:LAME_0H09428g1_1 [Lachancea meyersii CBS 8951]|uniref:RNA helicase n=1 Tax=Lachancea meyersii CBS 8951 TaxID=1266667 RepID=A0A1G4KFQ1_9SACH|nr:LAME_0H09428g1_1 [Lachancea meyersii CBS 8951]
MKRPVDINDLLGSKGEKTSNSVLKPPIFLSKKRRTEAATLQEPSLGSKATSEDVKRLSWRKNGSESAKELVGAEKSGVKSQPREMERKSRRRFQFDWKPEDDTTLGFAPLVSSKASKLLKTAQESTEDVYMGKHWAQKPLQDMTDRDWRILREDFHIETKGGTIRHPLRNWNETGLIPEDLAGIIQHELKYQEPTPIQRITIPNAVSGRDFLGVAATGSGKTLAFLIPSLCQLSNMPPLNDITKLDGPAILILVPTRELAQQIESEAQKVLQHWSRPTSVTSIVGGHSIEEISYSLQGGCDILVATPGRLIDCLESHMLILNNVTTLVLDEADRMIDLGFEDQVTTILSRAETKRKRQTMMFTATMSSSIERIANGYLNQPAHVRVGSPNTKAQIKQVIDYVPSEEQRFKMLTKDILSRFRAPIMIFINYKRTADWLVTKFASETRFKVTTLHGSKSQEQREHSLSLLRSGKADIMIATDVAGRGIDIPNVSLVVNYQMSKTFENYIHRIGRTGRAGKSGNSITFLSDDDDVKTVEELCKYVKATDGEKINEIKSSVRQKFNVGQNHMKPILF